MHLHSSRLTLRDIIFEVYYFANAKVCFYFLWNFPLNNTDVERLAKFPIALVNNKVGFMCLESNHIYLWLHRRMPGCGRNSFDVYFIFETSSNHCIDQSYSNLNIFCSYFFSGCTEQWETITPCPSLWQTVAPISPIDTDNEASWRLLRLWPRRVCLKSWQFFDMIK